MSKIRVLIKEIGKNPKEVYINNDENEWRKIFNGEYFTMVTDIPYLSLLNIDLVCYDYFMDKDLNFNINIGGLNQQIRGTVFFIGACGENSISLTDKQINIIKSLFKTKTLLSADIELDKRIKKFEAFKNETIHKRMCLFKLLVDSKINEEEYDEEFNKLKKKFEEKKKQLLIN